MSTEIVVALIAALAAIGAAIVTAFAGRGRLQRIQITTETLTKIDQDNPARAALTEVLKFDAEELHRSQRFPATFFVGTAAAMLILVVLLTTYEMEIIAWSPTAYLVMAYILIALSLVVVAALAIALVALVVRVVRWWWRKRRPRNQREASPVLPPTDVPELP